MTVQMIYSILATTLFWLSVITFIVGIGLLLVPERVIQVSGRMSVWIDTDSWFRKLDDQKSYESLFYRNHKTSGILIIAGSFYSLWFIWKLRNNLEFLIPRFDTVVLRNILEVALANTLLLGNFIAFIMGFLILIRPSAIKNLELRLNRWIETGKSFEVLDTKINIFERIVPGKPRLLGLLIAIGSIYIMSNTLLAVLPG